MKKLDWYILGKFLRSFFFTALLFTLVAMVIDYSDKVEDFHDNKIPMDLIIDMHYLPFIPYINSLLWPLYALIAVIFFTSRMAYNSEIISIFNAGVSYYRFLMPYLIGAFFIACIHLVMTHYLVPVGNKKRVDFENFHLGKHSEKTKRNNIHLFLDDHTKVNIRYFNSSDTSAKDFRIERFEEGVLREMLLAQSAKYIDSTNQWRLRDYTVRVFDKQSEQIYREELDILDTTLNLKPVDIFSFHNDKQKLTTPELTAYIDRQVQRKKGNIKEFVLEKHRRTTEPVTVIILTFIGVSIASRKVRGGMGLHLAMGTLIGALFIYVSRFSLMLTNSKNIPANIGIWLPNIIFALVALWLVSRAQK
ncbi:MAG TPA: LptF/LptG family permease [Saprospiraceae bacterium]|nr:LptF/LptG family permease [Saprospiraceae bacterium]